MCSPVLNPVFRTVPSTLDQATISTTNDSPRYDAAYLKELKASTPTARPPMPTNVDFYDADVSMDLGDVSIQSIDMDIGEQMCLYARVSP